MQFLSNHFKKLRKLAAEFNRLRLNYTNVSKEFYTKVHNCYQEHFRDGIHFESTRTSNEPPITPIENLYLLREVINYNYTLFSAIRAGLKPSKAANKMTEDGYLNTNDIVILYALLAVITVDNWFGKREYTPARVPVKTF